MCVCVYAYIYLCILPYILTHPLITLSFIHTHTYIFIYIHTHTYTYEYILIHTHIHTHTYRDVDAVSCWVLPTYGARKWQLPAISKGECVCICVCIIQCSQYYTTHIIYILTNNDLYDLLLYVKYTYTHTNIYIHKYTHIYIHTHTHRHASGLLLLQTPAHQRRTGHRQLLRWVIYKCVYVFTYMHSILSTILYHTMPCTH